MKSGSWNTGLRTFAMRVKERLIGTDVTESLNPFDNGLMVGRPEADVASPEFVAP